MFTILIRLLALVAGLAAGSAEPAAGRESVPAPIPITAYAPAKGGGSHLVLLITGEAGRTDFETTLARELANGGSGVLVLDAKAYLSSAKTPTRAATDAEESLKRYAKVWNRSKVMIIGNSRGADIAPFIANRLSQAFRAQVDAVVMLDPAGRATFEMTLRESVAKKPRTTDLPVRPELERLRGTRLLCSYPREDASAWCARMDSSLVRVVAHPGGHKLASTDASPIARLIQTEVGS